MVKYLHVRAIDDMGRILSHGGVTVAYTCTLTEICFNTAMCNDSDLFCYELGRRIAGSRLKSPKCQPYVIELKHPVIKTLISWIEANVCEKCIEIKMDSKFRWVTTFEEVTTEENWQDQVSDFGFTAEFEGMRYDG